MAGYKTPQGPPCDDCKDAMTGFSQRLIRMETRLVRFMRFFGLDHTGMPIEKKPDEKEPVRPG